MQRDRQGLRHRSRLIVTAVRHPVAHARRHPRELCEATVRLEAVHEVVGTQVWAGVSAPTARPAPVPGARHDPLADAEPLRTRSNRDNLADELVAKDDRADMPADGMPLVERHPRWPVQVLAEIRAADGGVQHPEQHLTRPRLARFGSVLHTDVPGPVEYGCSHGSPLIVPPSTPRIAPVM